MKELRQNPQPILCVFYAQKVRSIGKETFIICNLLVNHIIIFYCLDYCIF